MAAPTPPPIRKALKLPGLWISGISGWSISGSITTRLMEPRSGCAPAISQQSTEMATAAIAERIWHRVILVSLFPTLAGSVKPRREAVHGQPAETGWRTQKGRCLSRLFVADVDDLVALQAAGGLHLDDLAGFLADERLADRRGIRDAPGFDVGFVLADDLPGGGLAVGLDVDGGAEDAAAFGVDQPRIDHLRVAELGFDLGDAALDEAGALARGVVLGVFREVAMGARFADGLGIGGALDRLQAMQLGAQQLGPAQGHGRFHQEVTGSARAWRRRACRSCRR